MQVFQKQRSILGGIDEAIAVLKLCADWDALEVHALYDGDEIAPMETVMTIEGDYSLFAHLETVYLGCLARRSLIMRNVRAVVEAARGKPILFFPARHDHWLVQTGDGWAAHVAGAIGVSTDAQASWWGGRGVGTVPHGLIAAFGGDTVAAARAFADRFGGEMNVTVLVDFENDSVRTALEVADALGDKLWGVRSGWARSGRRASTRSWSGSCGRRSTRRATGGSRSSSQAGSTRPRSASSSSSARRWTHTASARRWCAARTITPRTWYAWRVAPSRRRDAASTRTRGWNASSRTQPLAELSDWGTR
jgi:hypothetical protein